jgi:hypothetical protein
MKLDFNNIDDVFKDGLEDFSEQPSDGAWNEISRKMLWHDILHLRFGNIPRVWLGSIAGIIVLSVLLGFWIFSGDVESTLPTTSEELVASKENSQAGVIAQSEQDLKIVSNSNGSENSATSQNQEPIRNESHENLIISDPEQITAVDEQVQQTVIPSNLADDIEDSEEVVGENNINNNQSLALTTTGVNSDVSNTASDIETENTSRTQAAGGVAGAVATPKQVNQQTSENTDDSKSGVALPATITVASQTDLSKTSAYQLSEQSEKEESSAEQLQTKANQIDNATGDLDSFIEINESLGDMQKLPEMGGISFSTANPVRYGQRPAERNFVNPPAFLNRGYQPYFSISAYYAPELTEYHRLASESRESSWLAGLAVNYNLERYTIQAGLEYSRFDDLGDYMVNINSYDSIGFYEGISGFDIDPQNPGELIYHTHTVEVWDTVQHHSHQQTKNHYSYLQIPVMFGYKAMERGIFSANIKAGPSFSFLMNRVEPTLDYQSGAGTRITSVDNFTSSRLSTNVQVLVSVALRLQITERVGILVEPTYRYYLNTVYDVNDQTLKNPYGIGVRGGIFFNFK